MKRRAIQFAGLLVAAAFALLHLWPPAAAQRERAAPMITMDPGAHTGPIRRIAANSSETLLVTASDDKTARLWEIESGKCLATLHTPIGAGPIGRLYGVAISPDNRVALGGTTADKDQLHLIYLYDLSTRSVLGSFDARGGNIKRLEWSPDGQLLAAAYADSPAIRFFDREGGLAYAEALPGDSYYLTFSSKAQLAVSVSDGSIHLYSVSGRRVEQDGTIKTPLNDPRGISFSPDGRLLAVGYLSRASKSEVRIDVFDVTARKLVRTFAFSDIRHGNLMNVVWQRNGSALYVAGTGYTDGNRFLLKRIAWPDGDTRNIEIGANSVLDLAALRNGTIVFATAEPKWGLVREDRVFKESTPRTAQFYDASTLQINESATEVSWSYVPGQGRVHFSLSTRQVDDGSGGTRRVSQSSTFGVLVSDWENSFEPRINGIPIRLEPTEISRAAAVLPGNTGVLLGTSRALRNVDPQGRQRWVVSLSTEIRSIDTTADGRIVVAALLDGTIRWWRVEDGVLLISFLPTIDRKWVLWTETGLFDADAGAEELVGWVVNRPEGDRTDFYPISRFRDKFYRPDAIDRVLATRNPILASKSANNDGEPAMRTDASPSVLPPVIQLASSATVESGDPKVAIEYTLLSAEDVIAVVARVNGRPLDLITNQMPSTTDGKSVGTLTVQLPREDVLVQLFASSKNGTSAPATMNFTYRAAPPGGKPGKEGRGRLYLLSIGINRYMEAGLNTGLSSNAATGFARALLGQESKQYDHVQATVLSDDQAVGKKIRVQLKQLTAMTKPGDFAIIYLAGRDAEDVNGKYYFLPYDGDSRHVESTGISEDELGEALSGTKGKAILFVDTCHRTTRELAGVAQADLTRISNKFSSPEFGAVVFAACQHRRVTRTAESGNGLFGEAVLEGLSGKADYRHRGTVSYSDLGYFVSGRVKEMSNGSQSTATTAPSGVPDFTLAAVEHDK